MQTSQLFTIYHWTQKKNIDRPCLAGAVLHTALSLIHLLTYPFVQNLSQTGRKSRGAEYLRQCSPPTMCHMSCVTCHVSNVRCQVSGVRCQVSSVTFFSLFLDSMEKLLSGGSAINGAYPVQFILATREYLSYSGEARGCSTNTAKYFA